MGGDIEDVVLRWGGGDGEVIMFLVVVVVAVLKLPMAEQMRAIV